MGTHTIGLVDSNATTPVFRLRRGLWNAMANNTRAVPLGNYEL